MPEILLDGRGTGDVAGVTSGNRLMTDTEISETSPTDGTKNNPAWQFVYDANNNLGSVTQYIDAGSYTNVLTWEGYSGTSIGLGSRVTNVGSFF